MAKRVRTRTTPAPTADAEVRTLGRTNPLTIEELKERAADIAPALARLYQELDELAAASLLGDKAAEQADYEARKEIDRLTTEKDRIDRTLALLKRKELEARRSRRNEMGTAAIGPIEGGMANRAIVGAEGNGAIDDGPRRKFDKLFPKLQEELLRRLDTARLHIERLVAGKAFANVAEIRERIVRDATPFQLAQNVVSDMVIPETMLVFYTAGSVAAERAGAREQEKANKRREKHIELLAAELLENTNIPPLTQYLVDACAPRSDARTLKHAEVRKPRIKYEHGISTIDSPHPKDEENEAKLAERRKRNRENPSPLNPAAIGPIAPGNMVEQEQ